MYFGFPTEQFAWKQLRMCFGFCGGCRATVGYSRVTHRRPESFLNVDYSNMIPTSPLAGDTLAVLTAATM